MLFHFEVFFAAKLIIISNSCCNDNNTTKIFKLFILKLTIIDYWQFFLHNTFVGK